MSKNGGQRKRGNFDSVPADDGFRNYMARKIELQRQQFGLVVPPPPPPSPPPTAVPPKILKKARLAKSSSDNGDDATRTPQSTYNVSSGQVAPLEKKSVRFHENLEEDGVSQVLNDLKQRHTSGKKASRLSSVHRRRRRSRELTLNANGESSADNASHSNSLPAGRGIGSVLGVLSNLQKKHGTSSLKKKNRHRDSHTVGSQTSSALESLEPVEKSGSSVPPPVGTLKAHDDVGGSKLLKRKRESPRCNGTSVLESLNPTHNDGVSQQEHPTTKNAHLGQKHSRHGSQNPSNSPFAESNNNTVLTRLTQPSPAMESCSPPAGISEEIESPCDLSQKLEYHGPKSPLVIEETESTSNAKQSARKSNHRPDLFFTGVVVLVNGHTSPDATTLMRLLHKHGGDLEKYETRRVTHIIAEQLSAAKANIYKRQKKPTPVCRPEWITDSVHEQKLLPFGDYLLEDVKDGELLGTKSVKSFFDKNVAVGSRETHHDQTSTEGEKAASREMSLDGCPANGSSPSRWQDTHPSKAKYHLNGHVRTVGNDPNFLDSYFSNSRLSYIGSFKQRVKPSRKTTSLSRSTAGARKFVLLVDMDCFFANVALRKFPEYRGKPVAVGHSHVARSNSNRTTAVGKKQSKNSSSELSTCNYESRKYGIKKGMFLGDAIQLCPELVVLPYDFEGFEEVSGIVADQLHGYAEQYNGSVEQVSCDESYIEININPSDCAGKDIYAFVHTLAEHIRADIVKKTECTASIGIGANKLLAKLAADRIKPNACCIVKDWREFLDNLNLRDIPGIGRKFQKKLQPHGLCTVNDIWDLEDDAENVLGEIIGQGNAHKIIQYCHGKDDRPVKPAVRKSIGAECNYGVRFDGPYGVDYMMSGLAKEVEKRMIAAGVRGSKLVLKVLKTKDESKIPGKFLGHGLCDSFSRSVDIPLSRDKDVISVAAMKLYERLGIDDKLVRGIGIVVNSLCDDEAGPSNTSPSKLSLWLRQDGTEDSKGPVAGEAEASKQVTFEDDNIAVASTPNTSESGSSLMPTFSQLDQDVLSNLPDDILSEVRSMYGKSTSQQGPSSGGHSSPKLSKMKQSGKCSHEDKPIAIPGQTSVRRMLKLACIKSGEEQLDGNQLLSLSQLESLPLEVQLQVANNDDIEITRGTKNEKDRSSASCSFRADRDDFVECLSEGSLEAETQDHSSSEDLPAGNFHDENIAPLRDFIASNPHPEKEAVETVRDFLSIIIHENRVDEAITFLRTIKNMKCGWGNEIYAKLMESTVNEICSATGNLLDIKWLGL